MSDDGLYMVYDFKRDLELQRYEGVSPEVAKREFALFYREAVRDWERRKFGRYYLFRIGAIVDGLPVMAEKPSLVMEDDEVRLTFHKLFMGDPPNGEAEFAALEREFERLDALDAARLARKANALKAA